MRGYNNRGAASSRWVYLRDKRCSDTKNYASLSTVNRYFAFRLPRLPRNLPSPHTSSVDALIFFVAPFHPLVQIGDPC